MALAFLLSFFLLFTSTFHKVGFEKTSANFMKGFPIKMKFSELRIRINSLVKKSGLNNKCLLFPSNFNRKTCHTELVEVRNSQLATFLFLLSAFCFLPSKILAQDTIKRPKIGLVLSGGGAKGFAHIGVLKVLEKAGIKIDYIGGTSMGAVVGGLYASGYNATQIDSVFENTNFDELLKDYNSRVSKSFYEKKNDETYAISLPFNKFKLGVPVALSKGLYNYNLLVKLLHKVRHVNDFNKLPIPFICIATDIEKGKPVILKSGFLPQALLASSAFPSLFSPVELDGKYLVDGGVTNNYPVEEVRKMGADIIIGVDVQDDLKSRESLKEATRILVQITNLQMIESMNDKIKSTDIYIKPDISEYSVISFDEGKEIIKKGEEATEIYIEKLKEIASKSNNDTFTIQHIKTEKDSLKINRISTPNLANYTRAYIIGKLGFKQPSKISYEDLKKGINKINATQNFNFISYSLKKYEDGENLDLDLIETKNKTFLKFGLHYDGLYKSAILVNLTQKKSLFKNDVLSLDVGLGDNFRYNLDYYIDNGFYFSFGLKSQFNQFNRNVSTDFNDGQLFAELGINSINIDFSDFTNHAYIQTVFAQKFLIGSGIEIKHVKIKSKTLNNNDAVFENSTYGNVFGYLKYDSLDNIYFPKKGWFFDGIINSYLFSSDYSNQFNRYSIAKGKMGFAKSIFNKTILKLDTEAGFAFGNNSSHFFDFVLGGYGFQKTSNFEHFFGYDFINISADSYIKGTATFDYEFYKKNHIKLVANYANLENRLFETGNWFSTPRLSGYAVGYGLESVVGPIEIYYSWSPELSKGFVWASIGFWF